MADRSGLGRMRLFGATWLDGGEWERIGACSGWWGQMWAMWAVWDLLRSIGANWGQSGLIGPIRVRVVTCWGLI